MERKTIESNYIQAIETLFSNGNVTCEYKRNALESFKKLGLPHTKLEDWKYTNISPLLTDSIEVSKQEKEETPVNVSDLYESCENVIVFTNGHYNEILSKRSSQIEVELTDDHTLFINNESEDTFKALNSSLFSKAVSLTVRPKEVVESPIVFIHLSNEKVINKTLVPKILIKASKFSKASVVEVFKSTSNDNYYIQNAVTTCHIEEGAHLEHVKAQTESLSAVHIGKVEANITGNSSFHSFTFSTGAKLSRNNIELNLRSEGSIGGANGLFALRGDQHCDNFSLINHEKSHTESEQLFKGILDETSRGAFTGKVLVQRDAQLVNSSQLNKNLLLSKKAKVDTRPQLEVYADDVKCAHGATVGQISPEEVFYLESRGIKKDRAQKILCHAFASEAIETIKNDKVREVLSTLLFENFEKFALEDLGGSKES